MRKQGGGAGGKAAGPHPHPPGAPMWPGELRTMGFLLEPSQGQDSLALRQEWGELSLGGVMVLQGCRLGMPMSPGSWDDTLKPTWKTSQKSEDQGAPLAPRSACRRKFDPSLAAECGIAGVQGSIPHPDLLESSAELPAANAREKPAPWRNPLPHRPDLTGDTRPGSLVPGAPWWCLAANAAGCPGSDPSRRSTDL